MIPEALQKHLAHSNNAEDGTGKKKGGLWMSDLGRCPRSVGYAFSGYPRRETSADMAVRQQDGREWEAQLADIFTREGWLPKLEEQRKAHREVEVTLGKFHGFADFVVTMPVGIVKGEDGESVVVPVPVVVEAKTAAVWAKDELREAPLPAHRLQTLGYMAALGIDRGVVIYKILGAGNEAFFEHWLSLQKAEDAQLLAEQRAILENTDYGNGDAEDGSGRKIPNRPAEKPFANCRWCDYAEVCWKDAPAPPDAPASEEERQAAAREFLIAHAAAKVADDAKAAAKEKLVSTMRFTVNDEIPLGNGCAVRRRRGEDKEVPVRELRPEKVREILPPSEYPEVYVPDLTVVDGLGLESAVLKELVKETKTVKPGSWMVTTIGKL